MLGSTNKDEAAILYKDAVSIIDRNAEKGKLHKNTAARKKARLTKYLNSLEVVK